MRGGGRARAMKPKPLPDLVARLVEIKRSEAEAIEALDTLTQNRWARKRDATIKEILKKGAEGRAAMESLMSHELRLVRMSAVASVRTWGPELTLPVLRELLSWAHFANEAQDQGQSSEVASHVLIGAEVMLAEYYGISVSEILERELGIPWQGGGRKI